jgi:hypothetical protein
MRNLSKKIASLYMQKQAGSGSLLAFPSVMFNLKELSNQAKDQVSDAIVDGLANVFHGILQTSVNYDQVKILKQEKKYDDIPMRNQGKYYQDTGFEAHEIYGAYGKKLSMLIQVSLEEVAEELANHLNSEVSQFFAHKNQPKDILKDLKAGSYLNAIAMFVKQEIKKSNIDYHVSHVEEFLYSINNLDVDFLGMNSMEGSQHLNEYTVEVKDVSWSLGYLDFLVFMDIGFELSGDQYSNDY